MKTTMKKILSVLAVFFLSIASVLAANITKGRRFNL